MRTERTIRVMGTAATIEIVHDDRSIDAERAIDEVVTWLRHVDATFSVHRSMSLVNRFARGEVSIWHPVLGADGDDLAHVLDRCAQLFAETEGVFDAWSARGPEGTTFDPSGYVKGWSIERAAQLLTERGFINHCVNVGGDLAVSGRDEGGQPWTIGVRDPEAVDRCAAVVQLAPSDGSTLAIATSGSYERGAHIIDPRSGCPSTELASATVIASSIALADAYATTLYVMGVDGLAWLAQRPGVEGCVITRDREVFTTAGFDSFVSGWAVATMVGMS